MGGTKRALIVEDDPDMARVLTRAFRARGFDADSVRDIDTAMAVARSEPPDCAILDLRLETGSGLALIGPLKAINPAMRILVLTGYASIATAVDAIKLGASQYLAKPAYVEEIVSALGIDTAAGGDVVEGSRRSLEDLEWRHILRALNENDGNVSAAARMLNMNRRTLQRKLAMKNARGGGNILDEIREKSARRHRLERQRMASGG